MGESRKTKEQHIESVEGYDCDECNTENLVKAGARRPPYCGGCGDELFDPEPDYDQDYEDDEPMFVADRDGAVQHDEIIVVDYPQRP